MPKLKYPVQEEDRHLRQKIVFSMMEVEPPSFEGLDRLADTRLANTFTRKLSRIAGNDTGLGLIKTKGEEKINDQFGSEFGSNELLSERAVQQTSDLARAGSPGVAALKLRATGDIVDLYLPPAHVVQDILNYNMATPLNISGAAFLSGANAGTGALQSFAQGIQQGTQSISELFTQGAGGVAGRLAATRLASTPFGALVPSGLRSAIGLAARVSVNPNLSTTFEGVVVRQFVFNFKFLPKSPEESAEVKKIVKMFRLNAYPEEIFGAGVPIGFKYPNLFKIRLLSGRQGQFRNVGTPIKLSYLQGVNTTYNPGQQTFHPDGSPTEVDMNLTFFEYKTQSRQDVEAEDNDAYFDYYGAAARGPSLEEVRNRYDQYAASDN